MHARYWQQIGFTLIDSWTNIPNLQKPVNSRFTSSSLTLLTVLLRPHRGYVCALQEVDTGTANVAHQKGPEKWYWAHILCTRLQMALHVFFVPSGILGLRKFGGRFLLMRSELSQDKLKSWTTFESNTCCYKRFLVYSNLKMGTKAHAGFTQQLFTYFVYDSCILPDDTGNRSLPSMGLWL